MIARIRSWPSPVRRFVLLLGCVATCCYVDFVLLDLDGSQVRDISAPGWTDFELSGLEAEQLAQVAVEAGPPMSASEAAGSQAASGGRLSDKPLLRSQGLRGLPRTLRIACDNQTPALSADPV